ncbi:hypothetical protein [Myxosarcina sp. GI1]|uniref:hypothetical protein n=1 Tax=Myxosarcina sp. GI1 TaxID=1541065 RepID=UPI00068FE084|nr:hypothetical protein [Myxosarcina sp. GI1]
MSNYALFWFLLSAAVLLPFGVNGNSQVNAQSAETNVTLEEINDNTNKWLGKTVTVTGTIENLNDSTFTIENEAYLDSERILVINRSGEPIPQLPEKNIALQVTGEVEKVDEAALVEGVDVELSSSLPTEFTNKPAIYADSIVLAPAPREVIEAPDNFYGRKVIVNGRVAEILNENTFTLAQRSYALPEDKDLLVLNVASESMPSDDAEVSIIGEVRPYDRQQLERDYGIEPLSEELAEKYTNAGILIVESISPGDVEGASHFGRKTEEVEK